jgi:hypothetical protein
MSIMDIFHQNEHFSKVLLVWWHFFFSLVAIVQVSVV